MSRLKRMLALSIGISVFAASAVSVSAATVKDVFDAKYYAETNPDLKEAFGDDEAALYNHYLKYGIKEGRNGSQYFDVKAYREKYADLEAAFGDDWAAYVNHYVTKGIAEERDGGGAFDAVSYAKRYPDVYEAYGLDLAKLKEHYETFGKEENREPLSQDIVEEMEKIARAAEQAEPRVEIDEMVFVKLNNSWSAAVGHYMDYKSYMDADPQRAEAAKKYNEAYAEFDTCRDLILENGDAYDSAVLHNIYFGILHGAGVDPSLQFPEKLATE